jgi:8-oxo-dGTP pyrophosphatase MutT (NUDIX family)
VAASGPTYREAAVLVPVHRDAAGDLRLVLVRRAEGGVHGGQIALPGGKPEAEDGSLLATALREAEEEIGLPRGGAVLLAELPQVDTMTSGFLISPFLVRVAAPARWRLREGEIAEVLDVRVADLSRPEARGEETRDFVTWSGPRRIPFLWVGPHKLWGATYRILSPLLPRLLAGEWAV